MPRTALWVADTAVGHSGCGRVLCWVIPSDPLACQTQQVGGSSFSAEAGWPQLASHAGTCGRDDVLDPPVGLGTHGFHVKAVVGVHGVGPWVGLLGGGRIFATPEPNGGGEAAMGTAVMTTTTAATMWMEMPVPKWVIQVGGGRCASTTTP